MYLNFFRRKTKIKDNFKSYRLWGLAKGIEDRLLSPSFFFEGYLWLESEVSTPVLILYSPILGSLKQ
jgi:hypothetical protein